MAQRSNWVTWCSLVCKQITRNSAKSGKRYEVFCCVPQASIQLLFAQFPFFKTIIHHQNVLVNWLWQLCTHFCCSLHIRWQIKQYYLQNPVVSVEYSFCIGINPVLAIYTVCLIELPINSFICRASSSVSVYVSCGQSHFSSGKAASYIGVTCLRTNEHQIKRNNSTLKLVNSCDVLLGLRSKSRPTCIFNEHHVTRLLRCAI